MTIAYWCILIAAILPYVYTVLAKTGKGYSNHTPREYLAKTEGFRKRANWAQMNSFEAFPFFAAAVIVAQRTFVHQTTIDIIAMVFIIARILYGIFYVTDKSTARSLVWLLGFGCCIALFIISAKV